MRKKILFCVFLLNSLACLQCLGDSSYLNKVADKNDEYLQIFEQYMNRSINPCEDFYGYACGNWSDDFEILDLDEKIDKKVKKKLGEIIENYKPVGNSNKLYDKVWNYYTACLRLPSSSGILTRYTKYADDLNWPLLSQNVTEYTRESFYDDFDWFLKLAKLNRYGVNILIDQTLQRSKDDPNEYFITIDKAKGLIGESDSYLILLFLGFNAKIARTISKELYEFTKKLQVILKEFTNYEWKELTIDELPNDLPWQKYFQILLGHKVDGNYRVRIRNLGYFGNLTELMQNTPPHTVYNYILIYFTTCAYHDGLKNEKLACINDMRRYLEPAMNFIYDTHVYQSQAAAYNADVQRIFNTIREALSRRLDLNENNLTKDEIQNLQKKLHSMNLIMNNLPPNVDLEFLEDYYKDLKLDNRSYFKNQLAAMKFRFDKEFSQLFNPVRKRDQYFTMGKHETVGKCGTFYLYDRNSIIVPYCLLQPPMYKLELHDVYKFSMFGFLLAHEMLHAFDYIGIEYDFEGKQVNISSSVPFKVSSCIIDTPFDRYQERYVDYIAMRTVYDILFPKNSIDYIENQEMMEREFFVHFAHFFCGNLWYSPGPDDKRNDRLYLALRNFEPFIKNFQCEVGKDAYTSKACF